MIGKETRFSKMGAEEGANNYVEITYTLDQTLLIGCQFTTIRKT
jgi:hypothetical protein